MDDLDKYLIEQMKDPEFKREWEASQSEFELEESKIKTNSSLTEEEIRKFEEEAAIELAKLEDFDDSFIVYDEDCPKQTDEELAKFERVHWPRKKQQRVANA